MESPEGWRQSPFIQPLKSPASMLSSRFPKRSLYKERCPSLEPFLLSESPVDDPSSRFPKSGAPMYKNTRPRDFSKYPSGFPEGSPPPGSLHRASTESDTPSPEPLQPSLKSPGKQIPSRFPKRAPIKMEVRLQDICISLRNLIFQVPR